MDQPCNIGEGHFGPCNGIPRYVCGVNTRTLVARGPALEIPGVRPEVIDQTLAAILGDSMREAKGDQTLGIALALKRVFQTGYKMGQACPAPRH